MRGQWFWWNPHHSLGNEPAVYGLQLIVRTFYIRLNQQQKTPYTWRRAKHPPQHKHRDMWPPPSSGELKRVSFKAGGNVTLSQWTKIDGVGKQTERERREKCKLWPMGWSLRIAPLNPPLLRNLVDFNTKYVNQSKIDFLIAENYFIISSLFIKKLNILTKLLNDWKNLKKKERIQII